MWLVDIYVFDLQEKIASFACFLESGLNYSYYCQLQLLIDSESEFKTFWELRVSITFENSEVSSSKFLHMEVIPEVKSFLYIKNKIGPNTDPCDTPGFFSPIRSLTI